MSSASVMLYPREVTNFFSSVAVIQPSPLVSNTWKASLTSRIWSGVSFEDFKASSSLLDTFFTSLLFFLADKCLSLSRGLFMSGLSSSSAKMYSSSEIEYRSLPDSSSLKAEVEDLVGLSDRNRLNNSPFSVLLLGLFSSLVFVSTESAAFS